VDPSRFVAAIREHEPDIVGMSGLLTLAVDSMKKTVEAVTEAGLRDRVKIIIGGNPVTDFVHDKVGSDAWTKSAAEGLEICRRWMEA
jgi:dimethylamine corrinoid protein